VSFWFINISSGASWSVDDPVTWCLESARQPLLARARERLLTLNARSDPQRILNVVVRRCDLNLLEVVSPTRVIVTYWTRLGDLRAFLKEHGLTRPAVQVALVKRRDGFITLQAGEDFLCGVKGHIPGEAYQTKWDHRFKEEPGDWTAAPGTVSTYSWKGTEERRIPWAALKSVWRTEKPLLCPNCDAPLAVSNFCYRRGLLSWRESEIQRSCFRCRRFFAESSNRDLWPWILVTGGELAARALGHCQSRGECSGDQPPLRGQ
jgi:hypothetical protein